MSKIEAKQKALQMKLAGKSLSEIESTTGLSRPTIISTYKTYSRSIDVKTNLGRPRLEFIWLEASFIQALINSENVFTTSELLEFLEFHHKKNINQRSFALLLQQAKWNKRLLLEKTNCQIESSYDEKRNLFILHAQTRKRHYWSFHDTPACDRDYRIICEKIIGIEPKIKEIYTDIHDLSYSKELLEYQKNKVKIYAAIQKEIATNFPNPNPSGKLIKSDNQLTHLERLEAESIHIMREVVAEANNPVMLYSIGKDSAVMLHLALKAFYPAKLPFPLLHVDTLWKFQEMYQFRDQMVNEHEFELLVHTNPDGVKRGINPFDHGSQIHTDIMKTEALKQALDQHKFDVAFGGARRDEEKSRAKERIFSFRNAQHRWDPKNQRPELWNLYNARKNDGESIRVFPLSNWTELDIWQYIYLEGIPIVPLYYAKERPVVFRNGTWIMVDDHRMPLKPGEIPQMKKVRFRTLGCYPLTGAVESGAETLTDIIQEMLLTKTSERQGRMIDHDSNASMEKKKQEGYF